MVFCLAAAVQYSQQSLILNQTTYNLYSAGPSAAGFDQQGYAMCHYKRTFLEVSGAPELQHFVINGALRNGNVGVGLSALNESAGFLANSGVQMSFRYRVKLGSKQGLMLGISGGFVRQRIDFSRVQAEAPEELSQFTSIQSSTSPDASFGFTYYFKSFLLMGTANHLLGSGYIYKDALPGKDLRFSTIPQYCILARKAIGLGNEQWELLPTVIFRSFQGLDFQPDVSLHVAFKQKVILGAGYRAASAWYSTIGIGISRDIKVFYSYEYNGVRHAMAGGGHEIGLRFGFGSEKSPVNNEKTSQNRREIRALEERLDLGEQRLSIARQSVDSLQANVAALKKELESLKAAQLNKEDISMLVKQASATSGTAQAFVAALEEAESGGITKDEGFRKSYHIVLGVYQLPEYARKYQRFLLRELDFKTTLLSPQGQQNRYIYVTTEKIFTDLTSALTELAALKKETAVRTITRGEPWVLQISEK